MDELRHGLGELAHKKGILVGQVVPSLGHNHAGRVVYLTGASTGEFVASDPAVDFGRVMHTELEPILEIGMCSPVGWWIMLGETDGGTVTNALHKRDTEVYQPEPAGCPDIRKPASEPSEVIWMTALFLAGVMVTSAVSRTRRYAIRCLYGEKMWAS